MYFFLPGGTFVVSLILVAMKKRTILSILGLFLLSPSISSGWFSSNSNEELWINVPAFVSQFRFHINSDSLLEKCSVDPSLLDQKDHELIFRDDVNDRNLENVYSSTDLNDSENSGFLLNETSSSVESRVQRTSENSVNNSDGNNSQQDSAPESELEVNVNETEKPSSTLPCSCLKFATENRPLFPIRCGQFCFSCLFLCVFSVIVDVFGRKDGIVSLFFSSFSTFFLLNVVRP